MKKDFINILDFTTDELERILKRAVVLKARKRGNIVEDSMRGKTMGMYFQKASLRTRVSLEVAVGSMGGNAVYMDYRGKGMFDRESLPDQARVMGRLVDVVAMRTFSHDEVAEFAKWCDVPVINALSDWSHPTQAMADIMTMRECLGDTADRHMVYVGDGNNVARSLAALCGKLGIRCTIASPEGFHVGNDFLDTIRSDCPEADLREIVDPVEAVSDADVIYTDVWTSMGQEEESRQRCEAFAPYQINRDLVSRAPEGVVVLHCLPAHRGEEITDEIMDDTKVSAVFDQAENRMHIMRALLDIFVAANGDNA